MSDDDTDLSALKRALDAATPAPDPALRAAHLRLAEENFARAQGAGGRLRSKEERPVKALWQGVQTMFTTLTSRGALTATTALVACGFLFLTPQGQAIWKTDRGAPPAATVEAQAPEPVVEEAQEIAPPVLIADPPLEDTLPPEILEQLRAEASGGELGRTEAEAAAPLAAQSEPMTESLVAPAPAPMVGLAAPDSRAMVRSAPTGIVADDFSLPGQTTAQPDTESFATAAPNPLRVTTEDPVSTFSIDVDTAAWSVLRQSLMSGLLPPVEAVRIEEMVNYFPYDLPAPSPGEGPFRPTITVMDTPWNPGTDLVHIAIQGEMPAIADRPPLNLVFLIDTSGSMNEPAKLPLLVRSFSLMLANLRPDDQVAIVTYAGSAGLVLEPTPAEDRRTILKALNGLAAGGGTNGQGGLEQAYAVAETMATEGEVSRILLATDGDFNLGLSDPAGLEGFIADRRESGTYLSVLGFGRGNLDDATMQALAQNGNGTAAYIDTLAEAQKVLVDQLTGALFPIAGDVKVQVEFNPAVIAEYRLIGYETRALAREDFNNDRVDAGELGAGHSVTAIYEVTPVDSEARRVDPLRYGAAEAVAAPAAGDEIGLLRLRWKDPGDSRSQLLETPILVPAAGAEAPQEARFATAIAGMGELLRGGEWQGDWGWDAAIALANGARGEDPFGYRTEAVQLMRLAQSLSQQ